MLVSLLSLVMPFIYTTTNWDPLTTTTIACKLRSYFQQACLMIYRWCLVGATFDRWALTSLSVRSRAFAQVRIAHWIQTTMFIVWLILPIHVLVFFDVKNGRCGVVNNLPVALYHSIYTILTGNIFPLTIILIGAFFIRRNLRTKRRPHQELSTQSIRADHHAHTQRRRDRQTFAMLLLQAMVYAISQTPWMLVLAYNTSALFISNRSPDRVAVEKFISFLAEYMLYLLPVSSFHLYVLASRTYRHELKRILRCSTRRVGPDAAHTGRFLPRE